MKIDMFVYGAANIKLFCSTSKKAIAEMKIVQRSAFLDFQRTIDFTRVSESRKSEQKRIKPGTEKS